MTTTFVTKANHAEIDFINKVISLIYRGRVLYQTQHDPVTREFNVYSQRFLRIYERFRTHVDNGDFDGENIRKETLELILHSIGKILNSNSTQVFDVTLIKDFLGGDYFTEEEKVKIGELLNFLRHEDIGYFTAYNGFKVTREYITFLSSLRSVDKQLEPSEIDRIILQLELIDQILDTVSKKERQ